MARALILLCAALVALTSSCAELDPCPDGVEFVAQPAQPKPGVGLLPIAHAHNDYEHGRPLHDALEQGFRSVEVDVWFRHGDIVVSHDNFTDKGTLQSLYLDPLAERLDERASVFENGDQLTLWIDLKEGSNELRGALADVLAETPFLQRYDDEAVPMGAAPVRVILTGDDDGKRALVDEVTAPRPFMRDSNSFLPDDNDDNDNDNHNDDDNDDGWGAYALRFASAVSWSGDGAAPAHARRRAVCIVEQAHLDGRLVRFYGAPDTEPVWDFQVDVGVDFLGSDDLDGLATFLRAR